MARTRQTARKSTGGMAPRKHFAGQKGRKSQLVQEAPAPPSKNDLQIDAEYLVESTLYAHYFETGTENVKTFAPRYALAKIPNPFNNQETEHWITLNFNSNLDGEGLAKNGGRPDLNLVVALDISGSMGSSFMDDDAQARHQSKLEVAKKTLLSIMSVLKPSDAFGLVVFESHPEVIQPLAKCSGIDVDDLKKKISNLNPRGGTLITTAIESCCAMYENIPESKHSSNRIFLLTDMEATPDDGQNLVKKTLDNSNQSIWTTIIGIGLDLTGDIINKVSTTPGCNYSNVRSASQFKEFMDKEFGYIVSPIGFNINVELKTKNYILSKGYGTPEVNNMKPGTKLFFSTEFPSAQNEKGERRAGALVFKVEPQSPNDEKFAAIVKYENIQGIAETDEQELEFKDGFQDSGIRKAVLLIRYTDFVKDYMKRRGENNTGADDKDKIIDFIKYFESEKTALGDESLCEELAFLDMMLKVDFTDTWVERLPLKSVEELKKELGISEPVKEDKKTQKPHTRSSKKQPDENNNNNNTDLNNKESLIDKIIGIVQPDKKKKEETKTEQPANDMETEDTSSKSNKRKSTNKKESKGKKKKN